MIPALDHSGARHSNGPCSWRGCLMRTVLVADDHPMFREALAGTLKALDDRVDVLESGSFGEAVEQISSGADIDLILLDLRMPGMNGVKGVRSLRVRRPDIPVAVI